MQQNTPFYSNYLIQNTKGSNFIMKTMKKIFALTLALMLVFSLALTANAAVNTTGTVKITNAAAGETYEFYRIYDLDSVGNGGVIYTTNDKWGEFGKGTYVTITDKNEVIGLDTFTTDTAQTFAQDAMDDNKTADKTTDPVTSSGVLEISGLQYGYYVMKSNRTNEDPKYTVFTLSSETALEITEKNKTDLPEFEKTVQEDSDSKFGASNTADVGEEITFKLTVTAAAGTDTYQIVDKLTNLTFIEITGATVTSGDNTTSLTTNDYTVTTNTDGFTVTFDEDFRKTLKDNDVIEITYTAKLTEAAKTEGVGTNEATFTYGQNAEIKDDTETKTYKITVTKTDDNENEEERNPLSGAIFVLKKGAKFYYYDETADVVRWVDSQDEATKVTSSAGGVLTFAGIDADNYTLVEIDAPDGYVLPTEGQEVEVDGDETVTITNTLGEKLPETGGMGTTLFYTLGGLMVAAAAVLLITKKRMSAM